MSLSNFFDTNSNWVHEVKYMEIRRQFLTEIQMIFKTNFATVVICLEPTCSSINIEDQHDIGVIGWGPLLYFPYKTPSQRAVVGHTFLHSPMLLHFNFLNINQLSWGIPENLNPDLMNPFDVH